MTLLPSILTMTFCMVVVFAVLIGLWGVVRLFSYVVQSVEKKAADSANQGGNT
jgi:Oxaloacetate decarboxylase, gamma chain.